MKTTRINAMRIATVQMEAVSRSLLADMGGNSSGAGNRNLCSSSNSTPTDSIFGNNCATLSVPPGELCRDCAVPDDLLIADESTSAPERGTTEPFTERSDNKS